MGIGNNWMQAWYQYPCPTIYGPATLLQWYRTDMPIPAGFDPYGFGHFLASFWLDLWDGLLYAPYAGVEVSGYYYFGDPLWPGRWTINFPFTTTWAVGGPLPARNAIVVRRQSGFEGRSKNGRFYVSGAAASSFDGDVLYPLELASFQAAADQLAEPLVYGGVTFTPALVSYKLGAIYNIYKHLVQPRYGHVMRRQRIFKPGYILPSTPKPPPP